jgi:hypothetical protein
MVLSSQFKIASAVRIRHESKFQGFFHHMHLLFMRQDRTKGAQHCTGPELSDVQDFRNEMEYLINWRKDKSCNCHEMTAHCRHLMEHKNLHLIQTDVHEACLNIEQQRIRVQMLAHAVEVERRLDPATRTMDLPSSQFWWTDKPRHSAIASYAPATGHFAPARTSKAAMPLGQLGPPHYTDFFRGAEPND